MKRVGRFLRISGGFGLIGLGIVGLFLPVLQGIAFIIVGLLLLAPDYPWARRLLNWVRRKMRQLKKSPTPREE